MPGTWFQCLLLKLLVSVTLQRVWKTEDRDAVTWRECWREECGFLVRKRPGLKEAYTLTSIINMALGFSSSHPAQSLFLPSLPLCSHKIFSGSAWAWVLVVWEIKAPSCCCRVLLWHHSSCIYSTCPRTKINSLNTFKSRSTKCSIPHHRQKLIWKYFHRCKQTETLCLLELIVGNSLLILTKNFDTSNFVWNAFHVHWN